MTASQRKRLEKADIKVLLTVPFFGAGVARLPDSIVAGVETAQTDGKWIAWGPEFFDSLSDSQLVTVKCHEVCHPMLGHLWRAPVGCDWELWNIATDHEVNLMLKEFSATLTGKGQPDPFPFPEPVGAYCADPRFSGMAAERIYAILESERRQGDGGGGGKPGAKAAAGGGSSAGQSGGASNKVSPKGCQGPSPVPKPHSMPSFGQMAQPKTTPAGSQEAAQAKRDAADWQNALIQAVQSMKGRGDLPGSLSRLVDGLVNPVVPWPSLLRSWLREQCADDWCFSTPDMCMGDSGFILPSLRSEKMGPVVFGSDWSGSTYSALVEKFHVEKQACLDELRPSKLVDIGFDTRVVWEREYTPGDTVTRDIKGGGGTCFKDFFRRCAELQPAPKCAVILTDLDGSFPDEAPGFPVIWVTWTKDGEAPFGQVVFAES